MDGLSLNDEAGERAGEGARLTEAVRRKSHPTREASASPAEEALIAGVRIDGPEGYRGPSVVTQGASGFRTAHPEGRADRRAQRLATGRMYVALTIFYTAAAVLATWPFVLSWADTLPAPGDSAQHLWIMNWNKRCLLEGKSPFFCAQLQYPIGVPLGAFSPLHVQSALFVPISLLTHNDVLSYNVIWLIGFVTTGLGVFFLAWRVTGHRAASAIGGLVAMLGGPVMLHAHAHLELHFIGPIALFLAAWLRLLDRPSWRSLAIATACYALMGASAAYFIVLMVAPASWIAAWRLAVVARREGRAALIGRLKWLFRFAVASLPIVGLLMSNQLWALANGFVMTRSFAEFSPACSTAPLWGYVIPSRYHTLSPYLLPFDPWLFVGDPSTYHVVERDSYLGLATLFLIGYAMFHRAGRRAALIWWSLLGIVVVFGLGCYAHFGTRQVSLPTLWLYQVFPPFRLLRLPARFNLLAVIFAAVLAAHGLSHLLENLGGKVARAAVLAALSVVSVVDLGFLPYRDTHRLPPMPPAYSWLKDREPRATLCEWPIFGPRMAERTYWSKSHGLSTSEGYSGINNMEFLHRIAQLSPLAGLWRPDFLATPAPETFGPVRDASFQDYLWLYLKANGYSHLLLHDELGMPYPPASLARMKGQLGGSKVFEDPETVIYDQSRMPTPRRPALVCTEGWKTSVGYRFPWRFGVPEVARLVAFNPTPEAALSLELEAKATGRTRKVRLLAGEVELAKWAIESGQPRTYLSPPFHLPAEVRELTLETDGRKKPVDPDDALDEAFSAYSLKVDAIRLRSIP